MGIRTCYCCKKPYDPDIDGEGTLSADEWAEPVCGQCLEDAFYRKDLVDDNFASWWAWRHNDALSRFMCRKCIMHRRKGWGSPHYDDSPEFIKRVERLKHKKEKLKCKNL